AHVARLETKLTLGPHDRFHRQHLATLGLLGEGRWNIGLQSLEFAQETDRRNQRSSEHDGKEGREPTLLLQLGRPFLEPGSELVGTLASKAGIKLGVRAAREFLLLEPGCPMVPVVDLGGQPLFHGCQRLGDQLLLAMADLSKVFRNKVNGGILQRLALEVPANPVGKSERREGVSFLLGERPVVKEWGIAPASDLALPLDLDELKPLRDGPPVACPVGPSVLDRVLEVEQGPDCLALVVLVHKHGSTLQQVAMTLEHKVQRRVEEGMPRADKVGKGLASGVDERLLEGDALMAQEYRLATADLPVAIADQ